MKRSKNRRGKERLRDAVSYRISDTQRAFLEKVATENGIGICAAARIVMESGINAMTIRAGARVEGC